MGLYLRKSVRVGPFKFNVSKSGVGISTGIKGFRVGTGPHGNYIHMGYGGFHYRRTLNSSGESSTPSKPELPNKRVQSQGSLHNTHEPLIEIDSGDVSAMVDTSSKALVDELNSKRKQIGLCPIVGVVSVIILVLNELLISPGLVNDILGVAILIAGGLATVAARYKDILAKTTVMLYDFEPSCQNAVGEMHTSFEAMQSCRASWHLQAQGKVRDKKYHAGASHLVTRNKISLSVKNPPFVKTNIATPRIPVGKQTLYFFPDKILVFEPRGVGAIPYGKLTVEIAQSEFIEEDSVPKDANVVKHTWKYVNKKGGADKRFKDNRQLPVALYEDVIFSSHTGLNERIQLSRTGYTLPFVQAINHVNESENAA